ncbi:MAG TPA: CocE/NonD family hydrolase [Thermoguttaceae bacterium]|nr:CocE/NonD family hydrolase [Thermoguttaceae bacterium]
MRTVRTIAGVAVAVLLWADGNPPAQAAQPGEYQVGVERNVRVRMRDGVHLATDVYYPMENGRPLQQKLPAVLMRTPYNKAAWGVAYTRFFAEHGYLSVAQDCRGRFESEGEFFPFVDDPEDGYDTIEWLARHPMCDGKVGMHGVSYMGWVQFHAATQHPPSLVTMIPHDGPTNAYHYSLRCGGALHLGLLQWILSVAQNGREAGQNPAAAKAVREMASGRAFLEWCERIPWQRGQTPLRLTPAYEDAAMKLYFENYEYNDFWRQPGLGMSEYFDDFPDVPILWVVGWYDWYPRTISDGYQKMVEMGRKNQHFLCGPWTHNSFRPTAGDVHFGTRGAKVRSYDDFLKLELAWFDRWLKGDADADIGSPVSVFVMGGGDGTRADDGRLDHGGQWHYGDAWPPEGARPTSFHLQPGGALSPSEPPERSASTTYTYDPRNTVSSNGRCIVAYAPEITRGFSGMGPRDQIELATLPGHGTPGRPIAERPDVLVFQTAPLSEDVRIAGDVRAVLWVSSDAPDTDFYVKLIDVYPSSDDYPNGYAFPVSEGILRARYRGSWEEPRPMRPGEVYRIEFPLEPSANLFKAGHRIRIDVTSSSFPNFDVNRNTGDPNGRTWRVARNTIHHDAEHPSAIVLPIWPLGEMAGKQVEPP